jgi:hypothetical protein
MSEKLNVYQKVNKAIEKIRSTKLEKDGKNNFSGYNYFTPENVESIVADAIAGLNLFIKFDLVRTELGIDGRLEIINTDGEDSIQYIMASAIPTIKATNESQQLGGAMTYTERYMLMSAFKIKDNSLDFDTTENTKQANKKTTSKEAVKLAENCKTTAELTKVWNDNKHLHNDNSFHSSERHIIEVNDEVYKRELDFFEKNTNHLKTITVNDEELFKGDPVHAKLLSEKIKADKKLRDYKFNKLNNHK